MATAATTQLEKVVRKVLHEELGADSEATLKGIQRVSRLLTDRVIPKLSDGADEDELEESATSRSFAFRSGKPGGGRLTSGKPTAGLHGKPEVREPSEPSDGDLPADAVKALGELCSNLSPDQLKALASFFTTIGGEPEEEEAGEDGTVRRRTGATFTASGVAHDDSASFSDRAGRILDNSDADAPVAEGEDEQEVADEESGTPEEPDTTPTAADGAQDVSQDRHVEVESEVEDSEEEEDATESISDRALDRTIAKKVLEVARSQLGYREGRNNDTKYGRWYKLNHQPWCAMFVSWVAAKSGAGKVIPKFAYCPSGVAWFRKHKRWGSKPKVGAIVFYKFGSVVDHVGIVEAVRKRGIVAIEGNTSNAVRRRARRSRIAGYGYPAYS